MTIEEINPAEVFDISQYPKCKIYCLHVVINDFPEYVQSMINRAIDDSWMAGLDDFDKISYKACAEKTVKELVDNIFLKATALNDDVGEYVVSMSAQEALRDAKKHTVFPLAEFIKERLKGNGGFDFHTESPSEYICVGEAKFSLKDTPRAEAMNQIEEFINDKKDNAEAIVLKPLVSENAQKNFVQNNKGYTAAFYFNAKNIKTIMKNALESTPMKTICQYPEFYIIAIQVC